LKQNTNILFYLTGFLICIDQFTKLWVRLRLPFGETSQVFSWLSLTHHRNSGFAFSYLQTLPPALQNIFFVAIPAFSLFLIVLIFIKIQDNQTLPSYALTAILGGAIGNMIDRFEEGPVLDIFQIQIGAFASPPFNLADISIVLGVGLLFLNTLFYRKRGALA